MTVAKEVFGIQHPHCSQHQHSARRAKGSRRLTDSPGARQGVEAHRLRSKSLVGRMIGQLFKPWVSATVGLNWSPGKFTSDG